MFDEFFDPRYYGYDRNQNLMKTDVKEMRCILEGVLRFTIDVDCSRPLCILKGENTDYFIIKFRQQVGRCESTREEADYAVADTVKKAGFDPYEPKLLGITAMEKLLGKKKFAEILKGLVEKPQGKPALVPESDKRPEMNTAQEDFKED